MANQTIFDLTAETAMTASHRVPVQDTGASTAAQSATFSLLGGLEWDTYGTPNQNNAAVVGKMIGWDISTLSADRNWTLPNDAKLGERCGIFITTGDDAYEVDILTDSTNSQINGVAHGSTSWSRLFISNECLILRCINAGGAGDTDWIVEYDGRIPCKVRMTANTDIAINDTSVFTLMPMDGTPDYDIGDIADTGNGWVEVRRSGKYNAIGSTRSISTVSDQDNIGIRMMYNDVDIMRHWFCHGRSTATTYRTISAIDSLTAGQTVKLQFATGTANAGSDATFCFLCVTEVLP